MSREREDLAIAFLVLGIVIYLLGSSDKLGFLVLFGIWFVSFFFRSIFLIGREALA